MKSLNITTIKQKLRNLYYSKPNMLSNTAFMIAAILLTLLTTFPAMCEELTIYTEESPNSHFTDKDGQVKGNVYEFVLAIQKKIGDTNQIKIVPWARGYNLAATKPNHILFSTTFNEERRPLFKWVGPVSEAIWVFYAKAGAGIKIKSLDDAKTLKSIGTYRDSACEQFLKKEGFTNFDSVTDDNLNFKKLLAGNRITLWASSSQKVPLIAKELGIPMDSIEPVFTIMQKGLFITFNKDTSDEIVNKWAKAYDELRSDGTMEAIYKKWDTPIPTYQIPPHLD